MDRICPLRSQAEFDAVDAVIDSPRDRCLFFAGVQTGRRASELITIRLGDARRAALRDISIHYPDEWRQMTRSGLHKLNASVCLSYRLDQRGKAALADLVQERSAERDDAPLFVTADGDALSPKALTALWAKWCAKAGLSGRFTAYSGRLTFALRMAALQECTVVWFADQPNHDHLVKLR